VLAAPGRQARPWRHGAAALSTPSAFQRGRPPRPEEGGEETRRRALRPDRRAMLHWPRIPHCKSPKETPVTIHFVVHEEGDSVGTIVVEGVKAGDALTGWIMEQDKTVNVKTLSDIPIGHKIALKELKNGDTVIKYGVDIGRTIAPIKLGEYLHVHNVKTKRW
jgi:(2R)-sulfolactate sulfo-lyase subunit alpha